MQATNTTADMIRVAVEPDAIHEELKSFNHWVVWKAVLKKDGKLDKLPHSARSTDEPKLASTTDSRTWSTFEEAVARYIRDG
jgi:primase-polymerase (primpol)-like protein